MRALKLLGGEATTEADNNACYQRRKVVAADKDEGVGEILKFENLERRKREV